jgi:hypothetical protein
LCHGYYQLLSASQSRGQDPPVTDRSIWDQLNLGQDTYVTQSKILRGCPVARSKYLFVDTVLVGDPDLAKEVLGTDSFDVDFPPHMYDILGKHSLGTVNEPQHMKVSPCTYPQLYAEKTDPSSPRFSCVGAKGKKCEFILFTQH